MSIETEIIHTLATVEVAEDYRVMMTTSDLDTPLTWTQTEQLIAELQEALDDARRMLEEDYPILDAARVAEVKAAHGFDAAPVCRECGEGKHGACTGIALVDGDDVEEHPCGCSRVDHELIGGAR